MVNAFIGDLTQLIDAVRARLGAIDALELCRTLADGPVARMVSRGHPRVGCLPMYDLSRPCRAPWRCSRSRPY